MNVLIWTATAMNFAMTSKAQEMVFCFQNCSSDREKLFKLENEGQEFANMLRSLEQFIQTVKCKNNF